MGQTDVIDVHFPLAGKMRRMGFQNQEPYTTVDCLNVRSKDVFQERLRGGSRPGLVQILPPKSFEVGGAQCIQFSMTHNLLLYKPNANTHFTDGAVIAADYLSTTTIGRSVARFDLSAIPASATVTSAVLTMWYNNAAGGVGVVGLVSRVTTAWDPSQVTWNKASTSPNVPWITPGGDFTSVGQVSWTGRDYGSTGEDPASYFGYGEFEITGMEQLVQDAIVDRAGQLDLLFKMSVETGTTYQSFHIDGRDSVYPTCYNGTSHGGDCEGGGVCPGGVCAVGAPVLRVCYEV